MTASKRPAPPQVAGPAEVAATAPLSVQNSASGARVLPMPLRWARALIAAADGPIPEYGSPEWAALPEDSRTRVAACVLDAERWRTRHHQPDFLSPHVNRRAREIAEARRPRPGDHPGGSVPWDREVGDV